MQTRFGQAHHVVMTSIARCGVGAGTAHEDELRAMVAHLYPLFAARPGYGILQAVDELVRAGLLATGRSPRPGASYTCTAAGWTLVTRGLDRSAPQTLEAQAESAGRMDAGMA